MKYAIALIGAMSLASVAQAQKASPSIDGWYGGISAGQSRVNIADDILPITGATATSLSKNETSTAWKGYLGYRFHQNFAIEGGYVDYNKYSVTRNSTAPSVGSATGNTRVDGWFADIVGIAPVNDQFSLFAKAGILRSSTKVSLSSGGAVVYPAGTDLNPSHTESNGKYGIGALYEFNRNIGVRLEWEVAKSVGDKVKTGEGDIGLWSLGVQVRF